MVLKWILEASVDIWSSFQIFGTSVDSSSRFRILVTNIDRLKFFGFSIVCLCLRVHWGKPFWTDIDAHLQNINGGTPLFVNKFKVFRVFYSVTMSPCSLGKDEVLPFNK